MTKAKLFRIKLAALALAGFFGFATENIAADKLRISYSAVNATQAFLWVALDKGIFAKHGLEGELLYINSGTMNIAALLGGSVQIAGGGPVSIEARLRGVKLTILGNPLPWLHASPGSRPRRSWSSPPASRCSCPAAPGKRRAQVPPPTSQAPTQVVSHVEGNY